MTLTAIYTRCCQICLYTKCLPCYTLEPSFFTEGKGLWHIYIHPLHVMRQCISHTWRWFSFKFSVIIQVTRENQILYPNKFQMKNHVKTHRNLTKITKEFYQIQSWQSLICWYKYNKGFYMDHMMFNENKSKIVTGAAGVYFTTLHWMKPMSVGWTLITIESQYCTKYWATKIYNKTCYYENSEWLVY